MAFSSNTTQSREMTELRNHLKWLDEERRKTSRKLTEVEQRLAQQGRDLTERDKRIEELEWQLAHMSERVEQMPELDASGSGHEQRLQDLEWHLSNINAQLVRLPKIDDELASFKAELAGASTDFEGRMIALQDESTQRLGEEWSARLNEEIAGLSVELDNRAMTAKAGLEEQLAGVRQLVDEELVTVRQTFDEQSVQMRQTLDEQLVQVRQMVEEQSGISPDLLDETRAAVLAEVDERLATSYQMLESKVLADQEELEARMKAEVGRQVQLELAEGATEELRESIQAVQNEYAQRADEIRATVAELSDTVESLPALARIDQELELRQAEEVRLANLIAMQDSRFEAINDELSGVSSTLATFQSEMAGSTQQLAELGESYEDLVENWKPRINETTRQIVPLTERLAALSNAVTKSEVGLQSLTEDQAELRDHLVRVGDDVRLNQQDIEQQMSGWQAMIDEHKDTVERFTQQWLALSNQYKEARMAVQNFAHWQKQLEQQKREASEMLRVESNRMQGRWDGFLLEVQEKLKNSELDVAQKWQTFELDMEQKWAAVRRGEQQWRDELASIDELLVKLQQDNRNLIWRVQAAQADAIKQWPRLLLEEVEKAVELNPNRRLQTLPGAAPRGDMSIDDAIEQGLIKVDYEDDETDSAD